MTELGSKEFWERLQSNPGALARDICQIDLVNLDRTLQEHPALRAWVNAAFETSRVAEERAKWELTKTRARTLMRVKSEPDGNGKPKTVQVIDAEVDNDEEVQKATDHYLHTQEIKGALRAMADALEDRKDMLIQISAKQRQELREH